MIPLITRIAVPRRRSPNMAKEDGKIVEADKIQQKWVEFMEGRLKGKTGYLNYHYPHHTPNNTNYYIMLAPPVNPPEYHVLPTKMRVKIVTDVGRIRDSLGEKRDIIVRNFPSGGGFSVGADPELFVVDKKGVIIPAFLFLKRKGKDNPFWDGFQAEFTLPSRSCLAFFADTTREYMRLLLHKAREYNKDARLTWKSVLDIPKRMMDEADFEHKELGCAPSFNVYPHIKPIEVPDPSALPFRFAGCHLHFGFTPTTPTIVKQCVKMLDRVLGIFSVALFNGMEDPRRRQFYGRAGEYRTPKHGLEYRTLSSAALSHPVIYHTCFEMGRWSLGLARGGLDFILDSNDDEVAHIINTYDVKAARKWIKANKDIYNALIQKRFAGNKAKAVLEMAEKGALKRLNNIKDMHKSWRLDTSWAPHSGSQDCCITTWSVGKPKKRIIKRIKKGE